MHKSLCMNKSGVVTNINPKGNNLVGEKCIIVSLSTRVALIVKVIILLVRKTSCVPHKCNSLMHLSFSLLNVYINPGINEPRHDKTNKMAVRPAKTQISLGICPVWSVFAVHMKKPWILSYPLSTLRRLWSDWADVQADLSSCRAHTHFVGFVMLRLK